MKKILITGSKGFIGRNLTEHLSGKYIISSPDRTLLNLLNQDEVEKYLRNNNFDVIIHAANQNNTRRKETTEYEVLYNNMQMFCNLQKCSHLYGKMYCLGSGAEYDLNSYIPHMREEYFGQHIPKDAYGFSKYIIHKMSEQSSNIYHLILFGIYGKYEEWDRRFISNAICRNVYNMPIEIRKNAYLDYLYIDDFCKIMEWYVERIPNYSTYNICRGEKIDLMTLAEMVNSVSSKPSQIVIKESGYRLEYSGDNTRMMQEIGKENIKLTEYIESIRQLMEYYTINRELIVGIENR